MANGIKIKLNAHRMEALVSAYTVFVNAAINEDDGHERLLYEHVLHMADRLVRLWAKQQGKYTVDMNSAEALAFMQWWTSTPLPQASLSSVVIGECLAQIDKQSKQPAPNNGRI